MLRKPTLMLLAALSFLAACGKQEEKVVDVSVPPPAASSSAAPEAAEAAAAEAPAPAPATVEPAQAATQGQDAAPAAARVPEPEREGAAPEVGNTVVQAFKANGFSPAWTASVAGDTLKLEVPETATPDGGAQKIQVERIAYAKGVNYTGMHNGKSVTLDIRGEACDRTGAQREFTATLSYGESTYKGCADASK